ncbi:MAG TPA: helix-turn-helix domain-containing protein [Victivallales bacterium]|nr:helix-turn-helix domain-containing protein [Victivallales bacterium]
MFNYKKAKELRKTSKISQTKLAKLLGKNIRTIQHWEGGERKPGSSDIRVIAKILNVNVNIISDLEELEYNISLHSFQKEDVASITVENFEGHLTMRDKAYIKEINKKLNNHQRERLKLMRETDRYKDLINSLSYYIYRKDEKLNFSFINNVYLQLLNKLESELLGKNNSQIFNSDDSNVLTELERKVLNGEIITNEKIYIPGSNRKQQGLFSSTPIIERNGAITGINVSIEDISSTLQVKKENELLENIVNKADDFLWIKQFNGRIWHYEFISEAIVNISGHYADKLYVNSDFWINNIVLSEEREFVRSQYKMDKYSIKYKIITVNGRTKYIHEKGYKFDNIKFGLISDITNETMLQKDRNLLLDVIDVLPDTMWVSDNYGTRYCAISKSIKNIFGISAEEFKKSQYSILKFIHPDDKAKVENWFKHRFEWWEQKNKQTDKTIFRVLIKKKIKTIEASIISTADFKKRGIRFGIFKDITKK